MRGIAQRVPTDMFVKVAESAIGRGMLDESPEASQAFLRNMNFLCQKFDASFVQKYGVDLVVNILDKGSTLTKELAYELLSHASVRSKMTYHSMPDNCLTEKIIPVLCKEACKAPDTNLKVQALFIMALFIRENGGSVMEVFPFLPLPFFSSLESFLCLVFRFVLSSIFHLFSSPLFSSSPNPTAFPKCLSRKTFSLP